MSTACPYYLLSQRAFTRAQSAVEIEDLDEHEVGVEVEVVIKQLPSAVSDPSNLVVNLAEQVYFVFTLSPLGRCQNLSVRIE